MIILHNIKEGPTTNYDSREKVAAYIEKNPSEVLTFDGVYQSVYDNRDLLLGCKVILFIVGNLVGGDNTFDKGQPLERYCNWWQLLDLVYNYGCELGWHTWSHRRLTDLKAGGIHREVTPPFPMLHFAYPYGAYNDLVIEEVKAAGFAYGYALGRPSEDPFLIPRHHLP